jgi:1-phosphofructokinase family hexose kinase
MIRTVTLNTGFDEVFTVSAIQPGGVTEVRGHKTLASGKGINAARTIASLGEPVKAYGLIGRSDFGCFVDLLKEDGVESALIAIDARTRHNLTLLDESSGQPAAHARAPGFTLDDPAPVEALTAELAGDIQSGDLVILHGSTPEGLDPRTWARLGRAAVDRGATLLLDIYSEPLLHALENLPVTICKPNEEEIRILPGIGELSGDTAVDAALRFLADRGVRLPVVSRGAEGLRFLADGRIGTARLPVERPKFLVGAGDACMAGLAVALRRGLPVLEAIRYAVAVAEAHVEGVDVVRVERVSLDLD